MATSGSYNYNLTATQIIDEALELIGVKAAEETTEADDSATCLRSLNQMVKSWQAAGVGLWKNVDATMFMQYGEYLYTSGSDEDHVTASMAKTEVATAAVVAASSIVIDATTGMNDSYDLDGIMVATVTPAVGLLTLNGALVSGGIAYLPSQRRILIKATLDNSTRTFDIVGKDVNGVAVTETITGPNTTTVFSSKTYHTISSITISLIGVGTITIGCVGDFVGIELDDGTLQWTNINGALSTTLPLVDVLTDDVAVDNHVYTYTTKLYRPLEIMEARLHGPSNTERPLKIISRSEYMMISDKASVGSPNVIYFDRRTITSNFYVWPACGDVQEYVKFTARMPIEDFDGFTDDPDLPQEWLEALAWNLAVRIAPKFGKQLSKDFLLTAMLFKESLSDFNREDTPTYLTISDR